MSNTTHTLNPSEPFEVTLVNGAQVTVQIQQLRIKEFPRLLAAMDEEPTAAELYCGKLSGWADTVSDKSIAEICEKGEAINEPFFVPWVSRRARRTAKLVGETLADSKRESLKATAPSLQPDAASAS